MFTLGNLKLDFNNTFSSSSHLVYKTMDLLSFGTASTFYKPQFVFKNVNMLRIKQYLQCPIVAAGSCNAALAARSKVVV